VEEVVEQVKNVMETAVAVLLQSLLITRAHPFSTAFRRDRQELIDQENDS
jgi:hypothetical protein